MDRTPASRPAGSPAPSGGPQTGTLFWLPRILADLRLDPVETLLLVTLADHIDAVDACFVGIERLATLARCSYGTARRRLAELEQRGAIERSRVRRDDGNLSVYTYRLLRPYFREPARTLRDDQRAPGSAMTSAHPGARAEPPRIDPSTAGARAGDGGEPSGPPSPPTTENGQSLPEAWAFDRSLIAQARDAMHPEPS